MKRLQVIILFVIGLSVIVLPAHAQLMKKAEELLKTVQKETRTDSLKGASGDTLSIEERLRGDSMRLQEMALQIQEMKLNEILLRSQLEANQMSDSLKLVEQLSRIDSLRAVTKGVPVIVEGDTLFTLYAERGGYSAFDRAEMITDVLAKIGKNLSASGDTIHLLENTDCIDIMYGNKVIASITEQDALWQGVTRKELALAMCRYFLQK